MLMAKSGGPIFYKQAIDDRSFDMFQNIKANNSQYQVMEANLIRLTYFLPLDLLI